MNGEEAVIPTPVPEEEKPTEEKEKAEKEEITTEEVGSASEVLGEEEAEEKEPEPQTRLDKLLAEEPTEKRTQYMIDTEIKTEAKRLQETGELTSEQANKIRGRGIGI